MVPVLRGIAIALVPVFVALYQGATTFAGSTFAPWRPNMVDLDVYRRAGLALLAGQDFYSLPGDLPFLYPPFAAVLAVPLAVLPQALVQIGWTVASALALLAILHRFGLKGWVLSLVGAGAVFFVQPVVQTLAFGQLGIFLVALVVLDLAPGPTILPRRFLPQGTLTAIATAIKLTPAIFVVYLLLAGKRRAFLVSLITGVIVTLGAWVVTPAASAEFWARLAHGDTGLGISIIYYTNQSVMADVVRLAGVGSGPAIVGLAISAVVAVLGVWVAVLWTRLGDTRLAICLCGAAALLASPVSWQHHFIWVVPLALCLVERLPPLHRVPSTQVIPLPTPLLIVAWAFVGWVSAAPRGLTDESRRLPNGANLELGWTWFEHAVPITTSVLGLTLLVGMIVLASRHRFGGSHVDPLGSARLTGAQHQHRTRGGSSAG